MPAIVAAIVVFLAYLGISATVPRLLGLVGVNYYLLLAALTLLGVIGLAIFAWFKLKKGGVPAVANQAIPGQAMPGKGSDELDVLIREAESRLAAAKVAHGSGLSNLPVFFVLGDQGTAKTSTILRCGLDPELLAGQAYQDETVAPTRVANIWYSRNAIFAEPSPAIQSDTSRWSRFVKKLQPGSLKSVVGNVSQAPRAAILCISCEQLAGQGAGERLASLARSFQARLGEISQSLGISFPVYVLFTKADRLPFFADWSRTFTNEEAAQVFGVTLPMRTETTGVYAEQEGQRLNGAFQSLYQSLCEKRLDLLPRESDLEHIPGAYEFAREFGKLRLPVVQLLVDMCRPSQLRVNPFLRGFYFSGVRPIVVTEVAQAPSAQRSTSAKTGYEQAGSATGIFAIPTPSAGAPAQTWQQPEVVGSKKVPQWMFLSQFFHGVLLQDKAAMGASGSSTRTSGLQKVLLGSLAAASLLLAVFFSVSFFNNKKLVDQAVTAAGAIPPVEGAGAALPSVDSLRKLETLRQSLERLNGYERNGRPFMYGMGLYAGSDLYPHVRKTYYDRFAQLLFGQTQAGLKTTLARLPAALGPTSDAYSPTYDVLKGYLITTSNHDKSTKAFLSPLLLNRWSANRGVDAERLQLAQKQFDFYSEDLLIENPYSSQNDVPAVERGRRYLSLFSGTQRIYQFMLSEAGKKNPPVNFNKKFPGTADVVLNNRDVLGAYTNSGWAFMQDAIKKADQFFTGERWVLGDVSAASIDRAKLEQDLKKLYLTDFIAQWRAYIKNSTVLPYKDVKDASAKLTTQSGNQSPILELFWLASQNTAVEDPDVTKAFQPVTYVVPVANVDQFIAPSNQPYMNALLALQTSIDQIAVAPAPDPALASATLREANSARLVVRQMTQAFRIDEASLQDQVAKLLYDPIVNVETLIRGMGPAELNSKGKGLCSQFVSLTNKFPFNPSAIPEATLPELNGLLKPGEGAFWTFYDQNLKKALKKEGSSYIPTGDLPLNPAFVQFFNNAARFSDALYKGGPDPKLTYTLTPIKSEGITSTTISIDGQVLTAPGQGGAGKQFVWPGGAQGAKLSGKFGGPELSFFTYDGLWSAFRLFAEAERFEPSGSGYNLEWIVRVGGKQTINLPSGAPLTVRFMLDLGGAPPFFKKGGLSGMRCVSQVAK